MNPDQLKEAWKKEEEMAHLLKSVPGNKEKYGKRIGDGIILQHGEIKRRKVVWLPYYMASIL